MNRREALKAVSIIMGGTVVGANAFLTGCATENKNAINELFVKRDVILLDEIGETIIPATDTPGAKAVHIGDFMAMMVLDCYPPAAQKAFTEGLKLLQTDFEEQYGKPFQEASNKDRTAFLIDLDKAQKQYSPKEESAPPHYFKMMKELTLLGYFTSEIGCTQARRYVEVPGRYDGCISYKKGDKAWAL